MPHFDDIRPWAPPLPTPQEAPHSALVFDRLAKDAAFRTESRRRIEVVERLQRTQSKEQALIKSRPESRRTESAGEEEKAKRRAREAVERLSGEAAKRQLKLEQIRREKEEQMLEEAYRLANTRHTNKESVRKLKNHEARTIAKVYEKPETVSKPVSRDQRVFTPAQAHASGARLMQKPLKVTVSTQPLQDKYPKDKVEQVVSRLYSSKSKPLSACNSGVKFYIPGQLQREMRTVSAVRSRPLTQRPSPSPEPSPVQHRESIHLRPRPIPGLWQREKTPEPLPSEAVPVERLWQGEKPTPEAVQTPQPTTKDSNDTPARKEEDEGSEAGSPTISSISHHEDDDSFTRLSAFPEPRAPPSHLSPRYSEEALFLMRNPIKDFMESLKSPTALQQVRSPLNAYRFVVGLDESAEFIYQEDKAD